MNRGLLYFLSGWALLALVQATFTDLANDEAYYRVYSLNPDWGYFDHPPVVGLMIRAGNFLISGEVGVRLMTILSQITALFLIGRYLLPAGTETMKRYFLIVVLIPLIHVFSFIAVPDPPLLLGTVIFLVLFKKYTESPSWNLTVPLAVTMAFMMYSKYHAALVILLVMFSKPVLFKDLRFMFACVLGALLFSPHLWWQYVNEFPSLKYHLVDRNRSFQLKDMGMYILNQLINFNPVLFPVLLYRLRKTKDQSSDFERALKFLFFGFLIFFLIMTWRGHIEPQWTYVLVIPVIYFSVKYLTDRDFKIVRRSAFLIVPVLLAGRLFLMFDILPVATEFHGYPALAEKIKTEANGRTVAIMNSYQLTAKYNFYTGETPVGMVTEGRRNQYTILKDEAPALGKPALLVSRREKDGFREISAGGFYSVWVKPVDEFSYFEQVEISGPEKLNTNTSTLNLKINNPYNREIELNSGREIVLIILKNGKPDKMFAVQTNKEHLAVGSEQPVTGNIDLSQITEPSQAVFGIRSEGQFFTFNSKPLEITLNP